MPQRDWNDHYAQGFMPWDSDDPDENLVEFVRSQRLAPCRVLDIGCGTGTHSLWLAEQGFDVLGVDLSPLAIQRAQAKAAGRDVAKSPEGDGGRCRFEVLDILQHAPPHPSFELAFDRGCFHVFDEHDERARFAARVAECLTARGQWLSLIGSTEGPARDHGPPRRSLRDISSAIEPVLEITLLKAIEFDAHLPSRAAAWLCLARKREVPAQPSTVFRPA
jgi:SAM-dependent methyltransferase